MKLFKPIKIVSNIILLKLKHYLHTFTLYFRHDGFYMDSTAILNIENLDYLKLSKNVGIGAYSVITIQNDNFKNNSFLSIGDNTYIGEFNNIRACGGKITIGDNCLISQHVSIIAANHSFEVSKPIKQQPWNEKKNFVNIGNDVWIGSHAIILPGVCISDGAVIGAGSVVTRDIKQNEIVVGNPIRVIGQRK